MIAPIFALTAASLVAAQPTPAEQPYYMQKASSVMVNYAAKYRQTGVSEAEASAAAAEVVGSLLAPSQATALVRSAVSYYAVNGPEVTGTQAQQLVSKASSYYDSMATKAAYKNFAELVHEKSSMFDVYRGIDDAQSKLLNVGQRHTDKANKLAVKASSAYNQLKADPAGAEAIASGKQLAGRVAKDFGVDESKVKSKVASAKTSFMNLLFRN